VVVQFENSQSGPWGSLDAYCTPTNSNPGPSGWTSEGFKPQPGDECSIQHNPQYGGAPVSIDVDVLYGQKAAAFSNPVGIHITTSAGEIDIANYSQSTGWDVNYGRTQAAELHETDNPPTTVAGAKRIDQQALQLVNNTSA